jgi:hypothetical protein
MENLGIFYDHLVYFTTIRNILWPSGIPCGNLVYFFPVLVFWTKKNLATLLPSIGQSARAHETYVPNSESGDPFENCIRIRNYKDRAGHL